MIDGMIGVEVAGIDGTVEEDMMVGEVEVMMADGVEADLEIGSEAVEEAVTVDGAEEDGEITMADGVEEAAVMVD
jgi:hypothetical protein